MNKKKYSLAKRFGKYFVGIDYTEDGRDKSVMCEGYWFKNKFYVKSIKEI